MHVFLCCDNSHICSYWITLNGLKHHLRVLPNRFSSFHFLIMLIISVCSKTSCFIPFLTATIISANDEPDVPGWRNKKTDKIPPNAPNSFVNPSVGRPSVASIGVKVPAGVAGPNQSKDQQHHLPVADHPDANANNLYGSSNFALSRESTSSFKLASNWFVTVSGVLVLLVLLNWIRKSKGLTIKRRCNYLFKKIGF